MEEIIKEIRENYKGILSDEQIEVTCEYWKTILTSFELKTKQEFLKRILPKRNTFNDGAGFGGEDSVEGYNNCREDVLINASKEGVNIK